MFNHINCFWFIQKCIYTITFIEITFNFVFFYPKSPRSQEIYPSVMFSNH